MTGSDFYIFYSDFDTERKEYTRFLLRENFGEHLGHYFIASREQVIKALKNDLTFEIYLPCSEGRKSTRLYLVMVAGKDYIRIDQKAIAFDN